MDARVPSGQQEEYGAEIKVEAEEAQQKLQPVAGPKTAHARRSQSGSPRKAGAPSKRGQRRRGRRSQTLTSDSEEGEEATNSGSGGGRRQRLQWTPELHAQFEAAVLLLGGALQATPKTVLREMGDCGLTLANVKSHLQKYRIAMGAAQAAAAQQPAHHQAQQAQQAHHPMVADVGHAPMSAGQELCDLFDMLSQGRGPGSNLSLSPGARPASPPQQQQQQQGQQQGQQQQQQQQGHHRVQLLPDLPGDVPVVPLAPGSAPPLLNIALTAGAVGAAAWLGPASVPPPFADCSLARQAFYWHLQQQALHLQAAVALAAGVAAAAPASMAAAAAALPPAGAPGLLPAGLLSSRPGLQRGGSLFPTDLLVTALQPALQPGAHPLRATAGAPEPALSLLAEPSLSLGMGGPPAPGPDSPTSAEQLLAPPASSFPLLGVPARRCLPEA